MVYASQFVALFLAIVYLIGFGICTYIIVFKELFIDIHKFGAIIYTGICGLSLFTYRILRGIRSRVAKFIHLFIHCISIGFLIWSLVYVFESRPENITHAIPCYIMIGAVGLQLILALLFFTYMYENQRWRLYFAPIHDIVGLWIYICLVGCCITGNWKRSLLLYLTEDIIFHCAILSCTVIVIFVVLCPFFEWDLVGKL